MQRHTSCSAIRRFFYGDWLTAMEREQFSGHLGPIAILRPKA